MNLSIVLPTHNEENNSFFRKILQYGQGYELLICDGNSTDNSIKMAEEYKTKVIPNAGRYRSERLNTGIEQATGDIIVLHHPRSLLEAGALESLIQKVKLNKEIKWGAFTHKFDTAHPLLQFTSFYSNKIRPRLQQIYYLDHCFYLVPDRIGAKPYIPEIPIFEDTELSKILRAHGRPHHMPQLSVTSSLRFSKNGVFRQAALNQVMKAMYFAGFSKEKMDQIYEAGLKLNSK